jgi:hypothetical protein
MKRIVKTLSFALLAGVGFWPTLSAKPLVKYGFESRANLERFAKRIEKDTCRLVVDDQLAHSGRHSLRIKATADRRLRATALWPDVLQTKGFNQGFVSFWFYDRFLLSAMGKQSRLGWLLLGNSDDGTVGISLAQASGGASMEWVVNRQCDGVFRHGGWTKFDLLFDAKGVSLYMDGVKIQSFPKTNFRPRSLAFFSTWGSGLGDVILDDIVVDDDPAAFHPAAIQEISCQDKSGHVWLQRGEPLELNLTLDPKGAAAARGEIKVKLLTLGEKEVSETSFVVDWDSIKDNRMRVEIPSASLDGSRHYWVLASYEDSGLEKPVVSSYKKINVQYAGDVASLNSFRDKILFADTWDFVPGTRESMSQVPADWSQADPITTFWNKEYLRNRKYKGVSIGWYRRNVTIPSSWKGRSISLEVMLPHNAVTAFIDGKKLGELPWPGGELNLTEVVKPGATIELVLMVDTKALTSLAEAFLGTKGFSPNSIRPERLSGVSGEVALYARPTGPKIDRILTIAHVAERTLELAISTSEPLAGDSYKLAGVVSKAGQALKTFEVSGKGETTTVSIPWPEVELWDIGKPNLYDLEVNLIHRRKIVDRCPPERFGFREVAFDGRLITINGNPISFEGPTNLAMAGCFGFAQGMARNHSNWLGSNFYSSYREGSGVSYQFFKSYLDVADEAGYGSYAYLGCSVLTMNLTKAFDAEGKDFRDDPTFWPAYRQLLEQFVARNGNRPGYLFPVGGGTRQVFIGRNPARIGDVWRNDYKGRPLMQKAVAVEEKINDFIRTLDPSRASVLTGKLTTNYTTDYQGFRPLQELLESNGYWVKNGTSPMFFNENASPISFDWGSGGRFGHRGHKDSYPMVAEYAAETKGDRAFHRQAVDRHVMNLIGQPRKGLFDYLYPYETEPDAPNVFNEVNYERAREIWLNFRADGLGVHTPWMDRCTGADKAQEAWAPVTGYIAGPPSHRTDKTHILRSGELWERQFLVLNSTRDDTGVECKWTATLNGKTLASGADKAKVTPGGQVSIPINVAMPDSSVDSEGLLTVNLLQNGKTLTTDTMAFQVMARKPAPVLSHKIALIDPLGDTAKELDRARIPYQRVHFTTDLSGYSVVVIGRQAFTYEQKMLGEEFDLTALLKMGKRVLVMEQTAEVLHDRFNFRTEDVPPRHAFGRVGNHPITADLPDTLLAYWRGAATLVNGYDLLTANLRPAHEEHVRELLWYDGKEHNRHFRWGNHHNVATIFIHKPERGNFRSLIDCGINLDYAAVLEFEQGPGRLLFCQMDISGRTEAEPAAERLLSNMVSYLDRAESRTWSQGAAYLGGPKGAALLTLLKAEFRSVFSPAEVKAGEILILGENLGTAQRTAWKDAVQRFVRDGGTCFSFPRTREELAWLSSEVQAEETLVDSTVVDKPTQSLLAGLSNSELYYTAPVKLLALTKVPKNAFATQPGVIAEIPEGKGRIVLCQVWPDSIDESKRSYMRNDRRDSIRVIQVLLNNLGIRMRAPRGLRDQDAGIATKAPLQTLDLAALKTWQGLKTDYRDDAIPEASNPRWASVKVPGTVGEQRAEWKDTGDFHFWYRLTFDFSDKADSPMLYIGAIDDEDDAFLNGTKIGHTGRDTNIDDWLVAPRRYGIPAGLLKNGRNELMIKVRNLGGEYCGISSAPVRIEWTASPKEQKQLDNDIALAFFPPIELNGHRWRKLAMDTLDPGETIPETRDSRWAKYRVYLPAATTDNPNTTVWYDGFVDIKEVPAGARPCLSISKIDDEDTIFVNGKKIGHTGKDSNPKNFWEAPRLYHFPASLLHSGRNEVAIKANNLQGAGAIAGPMHIFWIPEPEAIQLRLENLPYVYNLDGPADDDYWWGGGW